MESDNSIAIVGIGCIFPGANNIEEFWRVLENGEDHVQDIPRDRFNVDAYYDSDPDNPRKTYVRKAGLIDSYDRWDNRFFGISDKEAEHVDPQQFMVLETVHMALEDAGITKTQLDKSNTGVYIGSMSSDWKCLLRTSDVDTTNSTVTGVDSSIISARVSYFYNLTGPAITIDTACSSSLVAIHTAVQALQSGNGDLRLKTAGDDVHEQWKNQTRSQNSVKFIKPVRKNVTDSTGRYKSKFQFDAEMHKFISESSIPV